MFLTTKNELIKIAYPLRYKLDSLNNLGQPSVFGPDDYYVRGKKQELIKRFLKDYSFIALMIFVVTDLSQGWFSTFFSKAFCLFLRDLQSYYPKIYKRA